MFVCETCSYSSGSLKAFMLHCRRHRNRHNLLFPCGFRACNRSFKNYSTFRCHVLRDHASFNKEIKNVTLKCQLQLCNKLSFSSSKSFFTHLKSHIVNGVKIECPYNNCSVKFGTKSSFTSHLSRYHKNDSFTQLISNSDVNENLSTSNNPSISEISPALEHESLTFKPESDVTAYLHESMALFYLKLYTKHFLPANVMQDINEQFLEINSELTNISAIKLQQTLNSMSINTEVINEIMNKFNENNIPKQLISSFDTHYKRVQYFKENFSFVPPKEIFLGKNKFKKNCYMQYVPVLSTIETLLKDEHISKHINDYSKRENNNGVLFDVMDGYIYKNNPLFKSSQNSLGLILFQDSFEIVNPLGSARKKYKLVGVYFTLVNFNPSYRSNIDNIQLLILCRETDLKFFGQEKVFSQLITDLQILETHGVNINNVNFKGTVSAVVGDNLGSHMIGGFLESFKSEYFCRYCLVTQKEFEKTPYKLGQIRDPVSYDSAAALIADDATLSHSKGIKFESHFNKLNFFHVSNPGLPPCLGHDLFEGVVAYDLTLFIKDFVLKKKWFTYEYLNHIIITFNYSGTDTRNRPNQLNGGKITGHAAQNWCLLRLLPVFIGHKITNTNDPTWNLFLQLRSISEIICAPKISIDQITYLQVIINEYIELRSQLFPDPLKPKHHFLCHYPTLIFQFGPLIRLWTLRFESKHSYFKKCVRHACNFKNICSTLSLRHQLLQTYIHAGNFFRPKIIINKSINFHISLFNSNILNSLPHDVNSLNCVVSDNVIIDGIPYQKDLFLPLQQNENGLLFGKIQSVIIQNHTEIYFVTEQFQSVFLPEHGVYAIVPRMLKMYCVHINNLLDYYPLSSYLLNKYYCICLHHAYDY